MSNRAPYPAPEFQPKRCPRCTLPMEHVGGGVQRCDWNYHCKNGLCPRDPGPCPVCKWEGPHRALDCYEPPTLICSCCGRTWIPEQVAPDA